MWISCSLTLWGLTTKRRKETLEKTWNTTRRVWIRRSNKSTSFTVTSYQKCSWSVTLWYDRCDMRKVVYVPLVKHALTDRCVMKMTRTTSKAPAGITPSFWEYVCSPLGSDSCTRIHTWAQTHARRVTYSKQKADKQTSLQTLINLFLSLYSVLPSCLSSRALSCLHIQTHSHSGGVIECDSKSWEGCWRVIRLTCEMEPTWHQQVGSDTYSRHGWITPAKTGG